VVVYDEYGPVRMIRSREFKYVHRYPYGPHEFYDLASDPDEAQNLLDDPKWAPQIRELKGTMEDWFARYVNPLVDGTHEAVSGRGQLGLAGPAAKGEETYAPHGDLKRLWFTPR
jgi:arylsulfatase A-like enzyme